jgi:biopolymer transport protein ExbD
MAEVNTGGGDEHKKGKPKKQQLRVDFTPMVDMNMLLITFFMFCTTLSKPQMMNLVMPSKENNVDIDRRSQTAADRTITLLLAEDNKVYYYLGKPDYENWQSLVLTDYSPEGLRKMLVERNSDRVLKMAQLRLDKVQNKVSEEVFRERAAEIRDAKGGQTVVIKPTDASTFENLVEVLDEMQICSIGVYAIVEMTDGDNFMIDNYLQQGKLSAEVAGVKKKK